MKGVCRAAVWIVVISVVLGFVVTISLCVRSGRAREKAARNAANEFARHAAEAKATGPAVVAFFQAISDEMFRSGAADPDQVLQDLWSNENKKAELWERSTSKIPDAPRWRSWPTELDFLVTRWRAENREALKTSRKSYPFGTILLYPSLVSQTEEGGKVSAVVAFQGIQSDEAMVPLLMASGEVVRVPASEAEDYLKQHGSGVPRVHLYAERAGRK